MTRNNKERQRNTNEKIAIFLEFIRKIAIL